jgi:ABC-type sugar transport systems, ATPase components
VTHDQTEAMTLGHRVAVLQYGVLQQVATPQELYREPVNLVVAGFIGSPSMNLVEATLERGDGGARAVFGPHALPVRAPLFASRPGLERYVGQKVVLGIRPEDLEDPVFVHDPDPAATLAVTVALREELGSEVDLHCTMGVAPMKVLIDEEQEVAPSMPTFVARMDRRTTVAEGSDANVHVDLGALHFFDPQTGGRISD